MSDISSLAGIKDDYTAKYGFYDRENYVFKAKIMERFFCKCNIMPIEGALRRLGRTGLVLRQGMIAKLDPHTFTR